MKNHFNNGLHVRELLTTYKPRMLLELGALNGDNTRQILELRKEMPFKLCSITTGDLAAAFYEVRDAHKNEKDYQWINGVSFEVIPKLRDGSIDFCSIDTDHTSEVLQKELNALLPKLFPRCIIVFHDTVSFPALRPVIIDFIQKNEGFTVLRETNESSGAMAISRLITIGWIE